MKRGVRLPVVLLLTITQLPLLFLLLFFLTAHGFSVLDRTFAIIMLVVEAILFFELTGNYWRQVRVNPSYIEWHGFFQKNLIQWDDIKSVRQIILSPLKGEPRQPRKFIAIKCKYTTKLPLLTEWWKKYQPKKHPEYAQFVSEHIKDYVIVWTTLYDALQAPQDDVKIKYLLTPEDDRELITILKRHGKIKTAKFNEIIDLTYPQFYKKKHKKATGCWDNLR